MSDLFSRKFNANTKFTRMCIGEAIFVLMDQKAYKDIKVSDIVRTAGVSRMTFYHYYETKQDAVEDFLCEIVKGFLRECEKQGSTVIGFRKEEQILNALKYFDQYADFILKLVHADMYNIVIDCMNEYMTKFILPFTDMSPYEIYYYAGALLNVFIKWEESDHQESAEEVARIIAVNNLNN